jgi:hypothetical protein
MNRCGSLILAACVLLGCSGDEPDACSDDRLAYPLLVLETNFGSASALGRVETDGCYRTEADLTLGSDTVLADAHGRPFVAVRDQGVIREIARDALALTSSYDVVAPGEDTGGASANPYDVDVDAEGRLWVARYSLGGVAVIDPTGSVSVVDLSALDPSDGVPEAAAIRVVGALAYVVLQRLQAEAYPEATVPGVIAVIDVTNLQLVDTFELVGFNPYAMTPIVGAPEGTVTIALAGDHEGVDARDGLVQVDLGTGEVHSSVSEIAVEGSVIDAVIAGEHEGYAIVEGPEEGLNPTRVIAFDPASAAVTATLADSRDDEPGFYHAGIALNGEHLVVGDRTPGHARLRVFDRATGVEAFSIPSGSYPPWELLTLVP